jgi:hypothetical protein
VGAARSGEGVFGLRRAFMIAGAENLLMTLWPVADETTAKIMADFYKEAFATGDVAGSLAKVQRDWLVKIRNERGLLSAIREAGPFAMVVMTNPNGKREFVGGELEVAPAEISKISAEADQKQPVLAVANTPQISLNQIWLFADSSERLLANQELASLSPDDLWRARNELFARRGFIFKSDKGKALVAALGATYSPISPDQDFILAKMNPTEKANLKAIKQFEKQ